MYTILHPHFNIVKLEFKGYTFFLIFVLKIDCGYSRTASVRTINGLSKNKKKKHHNISSENYLFTAGCVFVIALGVIYVSVSGRCPTKSEATVRT